MTLLRKLAAGCVMLGIAVNSASASQVGRAKTIAVLRIDGAQAKGWSKSGAREKRTIAVTGAITAVLKGDGRPASGIRFAIEQSRNTGTRITAPVGPWSAHAVENGAEFVVFSQASGADWGSTVLPGVTLVCPAPECLEQVKAALSPQWESLARDAAGSKQWGPLLAEALVEQALPLVRQPLRWEAFLNVIGRGDLPAPFRTKAVQELFASLGLAGPMPLESAQQTMRLLARLVGSEVSLDLKRSLIGVYCSNLRRSVENRTDAAARELMPDRGEREVLARAVSALPVGEERTRFLAWLDQ
ncbi:MAG: hypothetical protein U0R19_20500 [Bryobacteraceae bacterium]